MAKEGIFRIFLKYTNFCEAVRKNKIENRKNVWIEFPGVVETFKNRAGSAHDLLGDFNRYLVSGQLGTTELPPFEPDFRKTRGGVSWIGSQDFFWTPFGTVFPCKIIILEVQNRKIFRLRRAFPPQNKSLMRRRPFLPL